MRNSVHDPVLHEDIPPPSERSTGLVFAVVAVIVAIIWRTNAWVWMPALAVACLFAGLAMLSPASLKTVTRLWFQFALLLNRVVSPLVMFVLFAVLIVPFGLGMQCVRDPLRKRRPDDVDSLWIKRDPAAEGTSMTNQF